ncbi:hypothetical protein BKP64_18060 [Marinobacter salinus]|uniref:Restriction endonuclease n=1 Tax=Marinobacter salinus TaxID=1874317 RepID=A0A1D9GQU4_9GAMM|nr:hypothetical protein [Marinobacter salinus]AOY89914.1 hypothetical protein BKP64_18060 [Marinobacter salinus]
MSDSNLRTLAQLEDVISSGEKDAQPNSIKQFTACDFQEFLEGFYEALDDCLEDLSTGPQYFQQDHVGEDRVTFFLTKMLKLSGFAVERDERAGNPDLVLSWKKHSWIGEAKIYKGPAYLLEGWLQLTTRYTSGTSRQSNGGILVYFYGEDALSASQAWQKKLQVEQETINVSSCHLDALSFRTTHPHRKSGLPFYVRHCFALLKHDPQDRSGRT